MISALILAAGESRRMGAQNKLLLPFRGKTVIETVVDNVLASNAFETIVVVGHQAEQIQNVLRNRNLRFVENPHFHNGMTTSIQAGVIAASQQATAFMICLSDLPLITPGEYNLLIDGFTQAVGMKRSAIVLPEFQQQPGNPVIFSAVYKPDILSHAGVSGCKAIVTAHPEKITRIEMGSDHILRDIDILDDYKQLNARKSLK